MRTKKLCVGVLLFALLMTAFTGCRQPKDRIKESGDFQYYVARDRAYLVGFSEQGKEKETIIIPRQLDGYETTISGTGYMKIAYPDFVSEKVKQVYVYDTVRVPFEYFHRSDKMPNLEKVTSIRFSESLSGDRWVGKTEYYTKSESSQRYRNNACFEVETLPGSLLKDWPYWSDHYEEGQIIKNIPPVPEKEGFVFAGWCEDPECTDLYDFEKEPFTVDESGERFGLENVKIFYAKWIKE